ncbi:MAG: hypothetical protein WAU31_00575, partial [Candidatus Moraniibacteriota bacterium]
ITQSFLHSRLLGGIFILVLLCSQAQGKDVLHDSELLEFPKERFQVSVPMKRGHVLHVATENQPFSKDEPSPHGNPSCRYKTLQRTFHSPLGKHSLLEMGMKNKRLQSREVSVQTSCSLFYEPLV